MSHAKHFGYSEDRYLTADLLLLGAALAFIDAQDRVLALEPESEAFPDACRLRDSTRARFDEIRLLTEGDA